MPLRLLALLLPLGLAVACGSGGSTPSGPSAGGADGRTVTITAAGVSPSPLTVAPGTRVLFVNNDTRPHNMASDPHPSHDEPNCEGVNQVGFLTPGQSRESGNMNTVKSCGYHDHDNPPPGGSRWAGTIVIR